MVLYYMRAYSVLEYAKNEQFSIKDFSISMLNNDVKVWYFSVSITTHLDDELTLVYDTINDRLLFTDKTDKPEYRLPNDTEYINTFIRNFDFIPFEITVKL